MHERKKEKSDREEDEWTRGVMLDQPSGEGKRKTYLPTVGLVAVSGGLYIPYRSYRSRGRGREKKERETSLRLFAQGELDNWRRSGDFQMQSKQAKHASVCTSLFSAFCVSVRVCEDSVPPVHSPIHPPVRATYHIPPLLPSAKESTQTPSSRQICNTHTKTK